MKRFTLGDDQNFKIWGGTLHKALSKGGSNTKFG